MSVRTGYCHAFVLLFSLPSNQQLYACPKPFFENLAIVQKYRTEWVCLVVVQCST